MSFSETIQCNILEPKWFAIASVYSIVVCTLCYGHPDVGLRLHSAHHDDPEAVGLEFPHTSSTSSAFFWSTAS